MRDPFYEFSAESYLRGRPPVADIGGAYGQAISSRSP